MSEEFLHTIPNSEFGCRRLELDCIVLRHITKGILIIRKLKSNFWGGCVIINFGAFKCLKMRDECA